MSQDAHWMQQAVQLARQHQGSTAPNPTVGAVIVHQGRILGRGATQPIGGAHAEVVALRDAASRGNPVIGATMYVTLEPCCHHGRTPPCTDAIVAAGIGRVVAGVVDPFPPMRGNGLEQLRQAGLQVEVGIDAADCADLVLGFTRAITRGLPEVSCKVAATLDGRIATHAGESQWITGPAARTHGHGQRASHDAILVGIGTVLADNPRLTCRVEGSQPVPVVLDSHLRIPDDAALFDHPQRPVLVCSEQAPERALRADLVRVPSGPGGLDVEAVLRALVERGLHRVLVEGGAAVHRSLIDAGLVDRLLLYLGPVLVPGGLPWLGGPPLASLADATRLGAPQVTHLGDDVLLTYRFPREDDCSPD